MKNFLTLTLYVHIASGFIALVTGLVPMFAQKGGKAHIFWGKIYFWAMFVVALTALLRFQMQMRLIFLAAIAIFSFYNTFTGVRLIQRKESLKPSWLDYFASILAMMCALSMFYFAFLGFQKGDRFLSILFLVFGVAVFRISFEDLRVFMGKKVIDDEGKPIPIRYWFQNHISRMGGSYIATVTAFLVVNNPPFLPGLLVWIAPGVIGGFIIAWVRISYRKKYKNIDQ
ncbi:MAG: DUF2306 domain-containing protein [Arcicella sp.]|nr:DUF2306 domain-containing protein [Arcicella sp.]